MKLNPKQIYVEISENTFVNNLQLCRNQIHKIKNLGFLVALDDFGREYSSLSILDSIDFDILKIDRLFIDRINHQKNIEIIKMILNISSFSNTMVIAEGIETKEQKTILLSLGCYYHQGYYYAKPQKLVSEKEMVYS